MSRPRGYSLPRASGACPAAGSTGTSNGIWGPYSFHGGFFFRPGASADIPRAQQGHVGAMVVLDEETSLRPVAVLRQVLRNAGQHGAAIRAMPAGYALGVR